MMGVQRTSVSTVATQLQKDGLITFRRGHIHIENLAMVRSHASECHQDLEAHFGKIFGALNRATRPESISSPDYLGSLSSASGRRPVPREVDRREAGAYDRRPSRPGGEDASRRRGGASGRARCTNSLAMYPFKLPDSVAVASKLRCTTVPVGLRSAELRAQADNLASQAHPK
jgi:hypothetical protein